MKLNAVLVDDEKSARINLRNLLNNYCPEVQVLGDFEKPHEAISFLQDHPVDCLFLDVQMPSISGFEFLDRLGDSSLPIIFVTGHSEYAIQALRANALDYLLKPINIDELEQAVEKVASSIQEKKSSQINLQELASAFLAGGANSAKSCLKIPQAHGFKMVETADLIRISADGGYSRLFYQNGDTELVSKNLGYFESLLPKYNFYRVHHSHLINLDFFQEYTQKDGSQAILKDGTRILISQRKNKEFKRKIGEYFA
ncbi:response regulator transcription factor [bacterium SCSIO 12741]|nr:response regulator transcription factor [bacterium SCSIO 12741]